MNEEQARAQLGYTLEGTSFSGLGALYRGKVRDVYRNQDRLVIITSDRVSAFDHVLGTIPFKGEILNAIAVDAFRRTADILPNHLISVPDPNVMVTKPMKPYPVEFVVRRYLTGSLWRDYEAGRSSAYLELPSGLKKDQVFPDGPMLTPSTKAEQGLHDEPISKAAIVDRGLMSQAELEEAEAAALRLFERGTEIAKERGLILVDTKYELGRSDEGVLTLIDELHTPDSSRYWVAASYAERFGRSEPQQMLDKENLRQWLIETHGFSGHGTPPALDDQIRVKLSVFYAEIYARILGRDFEPTVGPTEARIEGNLRSVGLLA